ncbi:MAG: phenylacetate--CoA ligase family protein [Pigmentiphaga sp.]|uniref:phenylacetate--CoA ligase family protein n=1 Tax=Pigmentiphaga sp. TaxID=1977564 RepID=UPI003B57B92B
MNLSELIFDRCPNIVASTAVKVGGFYYARSRFGSSYQAYSQQLTSLFRLSIDAIEDKRLEMLRNTLVYAYESSVYYRQLFSDAGLTPNLIRCEPKAAIPEILNKIPLLTRKDINERFDDLKSKSYKGRVILHKTSGTTGQSLRFLLPYALRWTKNYAHVYRYYAAQGFYQGQKRATLGGRYLGRKTNGAVFYNPSENQLLLGVHALTENSINKYVNALRKFSPALIQGHPSAVKRLINLSHEAGLELPKVPLVFLTGETLEDSDREFIASSLRSKPISIYGHGEMCIMASELNESNLFHVDPFFGYTELIPHPTGLQEIVVTSFHNDAMPFIRYRTGDLTLGWHQSDRNGRHVLERIMGRVDETVLNTKGQPLASVQIRTDISTNVSPCPPYSLIQKKRSGTYGLLIYRSPHTTETPAITQAMLQRLKFWLGEDAEISVEFRDIDLIHEGRGKHKIFIKEV